MNDIFSFLSDDNTKIKIEEPKQKKSPFEYTNSIYDIIRNRYKDHAERLDKLFVEMQDSEFGFICWILNHNLVYSNQLRDFVDLFTGLLTIFSQRDYVYWYVKYMIDNKISFPKFMVWYKLDIDNEDRKFVEFLKDNYQMDADEIKELTTYCNEKCMSIKDICLNIQALID